MVNTLFSCRNLFVLWHELFMLPSPLVNIFRRLMLVLVQQGFPDNAWRHGAGCAVPHTQGQV